ncbi:hypothetical protein KAI92_01095 [Candidatus Parcubacteria bacterium]|nr:hypothetical protein [Candidatus Parcubacteria bacterium]
MTLKLLIPDLYHFFNSTRFLIIECVMKDVIKADAMDMDINMVAIFKISV